jgi:hypothetical protein
MEYRLFSCSLTSGTIDIDFDDVTENKEADFSKMDGIRETLRSSRLDLDNGVSDAGSSDSVPRPL